MTDPTSPTQFCDQHPFGTHTACPACADARTAAIADVTAHLDEDLQRLRVLAHLDKVEAHFRASTARALLTTLENHARHLTHADLHDRAYAIWAEFYGDGGRTTPADLVAGVFVQSAKWLDHPTIMTLARHVWGTTPFDQRYADNRVQWMPEDAVVILTIPHLLSDGTRVVADVVVSDTNMAGALR
ncbi:hypothetical protein [uncultured Microbacterium sp.]|uniref:hypothetical protein n=1 Tax=uncultured Microbacterium sp. TaxID=191216 RepID=UPI0025D75B75|nr:hypothetical protein [uncultured Microbacterium sp.]